MRIVRFLLIILLTIYPIVELTRVIVERDIIKYHCALASPTTYAIELSFMWATYIVAIMLVYRLLRKG